MSYEKSALILDHIDRGTINTSLQANNYWKTLKLLNSSAKNWESICDIIEEADNDLIVLGKFTEHTLFRMCLPEYKNVVEKLIQLLSERKHLIFIYKENLLGNFSFFNSVDFKPTVLEVDEKDDYFFYKDNEIESWIKKHNLLETPKEYLAKVQSLISLINSELNTLPYEKLIDVEISGQNFIENVAEGLLFRIYVPNKRIWSEQFDRFITLFRDYASNVANEELNYHRLKTDGFDFV